MERITPDNMNVALAKITEFLDKGPVNVSNGGVNYGPVSIKPKLEHKPVILLNPGSRGTITLPVLDLCESEGGGSAGALAIYPIDSEGQTFYELHPTSLTFTMRTHNGAHKIWLIRP